LFSARRPVQEDIFPLKYIYWNKLEKETNKTNSSGVIPNTTTQTSGEKSHCYCYFFRRPDT